MICPKCTNLSADGQKCHFCGFDPNDPRAALALTQEPALSSGWAFIRTSCVALFSIEAALCIWSLIAYRGPTTYMLGIPVSLFLAASFGLLGLSVAKSKSTGYIGTALFFQSFALVAGIIGVLLLGAISRGGR